MKKTILITIFSLFALSTSFAEEHAPTKSLILGRVAHMTWEDVYEGYATVKQIVVTQDGNSIVTFEVFGQPHFNANNSYVALPYCADDGCKANVTIIDFSTLKQESFELPNTTGMLIVETDWIEQKVLGLRASTSTDGMETFYKYYPENNKLSEVLSRKYDAFRRDNPLK